MIKDVTMGEFFYIDMRDKYAPDGSPTKSLVVLDKNEVKDAKLIAHCKKLYGKNRDFEACETYLGSLKEIQQRNLCGLLRALLRVNPTCSAENAAFIVNVFKELERLRCWALHNATITPMTDFLDQALARTFLDNKKRTCTSTSWFNRSKVLLGHVLDVVSVTQLFRAKKDWHLHRDQVQKIVGSTAVGAKLFEKAWITIRNGDLAILVTDAVGKFSQLDDITQEVLDRNQEGFEIEVLVDSKDGGLRVRGTVCEKRCKGLLFNIFVARRLVRFRIVRSLIVVLLFPRVGALNRCICFLTVPLA